MEHNLNLSKVQMRKLLNGKPVQLQPSSLSGGSIKTLLDTPIHKKIVKALRLNKGARVVLSPDAISQNVMKNPDFSNLLSQAKLNKLTGGSIQGDFKKFGKMLNRTIVKPIVKNQAPILKAVSSVAIPLATSALKKYTGLNFSGGDKLLTQYTNRRIERDLGNKNKSNANNAPIIPYQAVAVPITSANANNLIQDANNDPVLNGGSVGFRMIQKTRKPIGKPKPINLSNGFIVPTGGALRPSGGALKPSGRY